MNRFQVVFAQLVARYQRQMLIGGVGLGCTLLLLVGAWLLLNMLFAPPIPNPEVATAQEVAEFLSDERGLARLPIPQRKQVFGQIMYTYGNNPGKRELLVDRIEKMAPSERAVIREAVFEIVKDEVLIHAKEFRKLKDEKDQQKYIETKLNEYDSIRQEFRGQDGVSNVGESFMKDPGVPAKSDAWAKAVVARTNPRERALAKPYVDKIGEVLDQRKADSGKSKGRTMTVINPPAATPTPSPG